jgi:hypothetical protein
MSPNSQGIDNITLIAHYEAFKKMAEKMGLTMRPMAKSHKLYKKIFDEVNTDTKQRREKDNFTPIIEVINLPKVDPKDKYFQIVIIRNSLSLFNIATKNKKAKDTYCMVTIAGLHQPQKKLSSDAIKIISKFLKRKTFKLHRVDFAKDIKDHRPIDYKGIEAFRERFKLYSNGWVVLPLKNPKKLDKKKDKKNLNYHTTYYINNIDHRSIDTILYYDKYNKSVQKKENVTFKDRHWKRLEVVLKFDVTRAKSFNFVDYINSMDFLNDFSDLEVMAKRAGIKNYSNDYLEYQINSFIDNRFLNNKQSQKQFNLYEALKNFNEKEFRRYVLII